MREYIALAGVVTGLGILLSLAALLVCNIVPVLFVDAFLSCVVAFLFVDNWTLSIDLQAKESPILSFVTKEKNHIQIIGQMSVENNNLLMSNKRLTVCNNLSLETLHWNMLAKKALALNEIGKIQIHQKPKRTVSM